MSKALDWDRARRREGIATPLPTGATDAQLAYIADLAEEVGVTITRAPETVREASLVIDGLKRRARRARQQ